MQMMDEGTRAAGRRVGCLLALAVVLVVAQGCDFAEEEVALPGTYEATVLTLRVPQDSTMVEADVLAAGGRVEMTLVENKHANGIDRHVQGRLFLPKSLFGGRVEEDVEVPFEGNYFFVVDRLTLHLETPVPLPQVLSYENGRLWTESEARFFIRDLAPVPLHLTAFEMQKQP